MWSDTTPVLPSPFSTPAALHPVWVVSRFCLQPSFRNSSRFIFSTCFVSQCSEKCSHRFYTLFFGRLQCDEPYPVAPTMLCSAHFTSLSLALPVPGNLCDWCAGADLKMC